MHWVGGGLMSGKGTKNLQVMCESICMNVFVFLFYSYCNAKKASIMCAYFCLKQLSNSIKFFWIELNWIKRCWTNTNWLSIEKKLFAGQQWYYLWTLISTVSWGPYTYHRWIFKEEFESVLTNTESVFIYTNCMATGSN